MKVNLRSIVFWVLIGSGFCSVGAGLAELERDFLQPPRKAGGRCWWWWLNSNVTKEAITRDLESMHDKGFSGAMIFDAHGGNQRGNANVPNGPMFAGKEWTELYMHALREAKRLDLKIGLSIQSGWNLGGPRVTLDDKAKQITSSEIQVEGPANLRLELPAPRANYDYYRDICVLAYPRKALQGMPFKLTASSEQSNHPANNIPGDGFWVSAGKEGGQGPSQKNPEWIQFSFDRKVTVSGLNITGRPGYGPKVCRLESVDSGQRSKKFNLKNGSNKLSFDVITGKSIRIVFEDSYDPKFPDSPRNVQVLSAQLLDQDGKALMPGESGAGRADQQSYTQNRSEGAGDVGAGLPFPAGLYSLGFR